MCCFFASLFFLGPRFAFLIYWLIPYGRRKINAAFNTFFWPLLGLILVPWTTLMYTILYVPGDGLWSGITGFDWIWLGFAIFADKKLVVIDRSLNGLLSFALNTFGH